MAWAENLGFGSRLHTAFLSILIVKHSSPTINRKLNKLTQQVLLEYLKKFFLDLKLDLKPHRCKTLLPYGKKNTPSNHK